MISAVTELSESIHKMEELIEEYHSSLEDLTFNSKPHINMLTILADENKKYAEYIVQIIEERIAKASVRLPILYLLDSIVKNVGESYKTLFSKNLSNTFKLAFEASNDKEKMSLYKLRTTWDKIFPLKKLYSLDVSIKDLDPNWPVKPLPANLQDNAAKNIHVNPKFLKKTESGSSVSPSVTKATKKAVPKTTSSSATAQPATEMDLIKQQLVRQQQQLLDLQQKKLLLELEQTKNQLAAKQRETLKKQDKMPHDPRSQSSNSGVPGNLRVTLSNTKAASASGGTNSISQKDPRIKSSNKKASQEMIKPNGKGGSSKKKRLPEKKEKVTPDSSPAKVKTSKSSVLKQSPEKKSNLTMKKALKGGLQNQGVADPNNNLAIELEHQKKRSFPSRSMTSPSPPPAKVLKTTQPSKITETLSTPNRKIRHDIPSDPRRKRMERKNQRIESLKDQSKDSSRSSDGSISPRFSPEPDTDDSMSTGSHAHVPFHGKRNDALQRRPSFDPDIHIPQQLTLEHQHEILRQADRQLQTGQLTHKQHQEILKKLHQLFEVQRFQKEDETPRHDSRIIRERNRSPVDPRRMKKGDRIPKRHAVYQRTQCTGPNDMEMIDDAYNEKRGPMQSRPDVRRPPIGQGELRDKRRPPLPDHRLPPAKRRNISPNLPPQNMRHRMPPHGAEKHRSEPPMQNMHRPPFPRPRARGLPQPSSPHRHPRLSPPPVFLQKDRARLNNEPRHDQSLQMSPPPMPPKLGEGQRGSRDIMGSNVGEQKNLRRFANDDNRNNSMPPRRQEGKERSRAKQTIERRKPLKPEVLAEDRNEKTGLEEPEDYIIANIPVSVEEPENKLEEPEDYIIAGMKTAMEERRESCEEPEDFIIADMPIEDELVDETKGSKRTTESEQAYLEHMKKIKLSMYSREREAKQRLSESTANNDVGSSEKSSNESEQTAKKEDASKSPSLPLKKRRYISSDETKNVEKKTPERTSTPAVLSKNSTAETPAQTADEKNKADKDLKLSEKEPINKQQTKLSEDKKLSLHLSSTTVLDSKPEISVKSNMEPEKVVKSDVKSEKLTKSDVKSEKLTKSDVKPEKLTKSDVKPETLTKSNAKPEKVSKSEAKPEKVSKSEAKPENVSKSEAKPEKVSKSETKLEKLTKSGVKPEKLPKSDKPDKSTKSDVKKEKASITSKSESKIRERRSVKPPVKENRKEEPEKDESSLVYVIEEEEEENGRKFEGRGRGGRKMRERVPRMKDWNKDKEEEEARLQMILEEEKKQREWEEILHRELEMEQMNEDRMRRGRGRPGRERAPFLHPDRWESPPRDMQDPPPLDIARGRLPRRGPLPRLHPLRHGGRSHRRGRPFHPGDELREPHRDDLRRPPPPEFRGPPPPGWERVRRSPPPPPLHPQDERPPEWDRPMGRVPLREPMFHPEDRRPPVQEFRPAPPHREPPPPAASINQVNVNKLLSDLVGMGIIPGSKKPGSKSSSPAPVDTRADSPQAVPAAPVKSDAINTSPVKAETKPETRSISPFIEEDLMVLDPDSNIPSITFDSDLKLRHDEIIKRLYTGIQCSACGLRFTTRQTDLYADHLDWHYRTNKKEKDGSTPFHREWYASAGDWITYEEIENPGERTKNFFDEDMEGQGVNLEGDELTVPLTGKSGEDKCKVCNEAFETFYNEAEDEWQFARCVKVDGENFHPNCYEDHSELTPLPTIMQTPLYNPTDGGAVIPGLDTSLVKEEAEHKVEENKEQETAQNSPINVDSLPDDASDVVEIQQQPLSSAVEEEVPEKIVVEEEAPKDLPTASITNAVDPPPPPAEATTGPTEPGKETDDSTKHSDSEVIVDTEKKVQEIPNIDLTTSPDEETPPDNIFPKVENIVAEPMDTEGQPQADEIPQAQETQ